MFAALLQQLSFTMHGGPLGVQYDRAEGRLDTQRLRSPYMDIRPASACWVKEQSVEMLQRFGSAFEDEAEKKYAFENLLLSGSRDALLDAALLEVASAAGSRLAGFEDARLVTYVDGAVTPENVLIVASRGEV